ncbi:uncharacterized protein LOC142987734 isoform X3 [Anticarsia gemmatalis]|uniref:uncharacterized protein LOC142987734 isoform X3 n=1 Tax=Anticarsia gemmatalis TaxID=129554 RepID=UPI003F7757C7
MNQVELVKFCKELGCCDACCLRYLGLKTPSSYENVHRHILSYLNTNTGDQSKDEEQAKENQKEPENSLCVRVSEPAVEDSVNDAEDVLTVPPAKRMKLDDVCISCLGVLQEETWPEGFDMVQEVLQTKRVSDATEGSVEVVLRAAAGGARRQAAGLRRRRAPARHTHRRVPGRPAGAGGAEEPGAGAVRVAQQAAAALRRGVHAARGGAGAGPRDAGGAARPGAARPAPAARRRARAPRGGAGAARAAVPRRPLPQAEPRPAADAVAGGGPPHDGLLRAGDHLRTGRRRLRGAAGRGGALPQVHVGGARGRGRALSRHRPPFRTRDLGPAAATRRRRAATRVRAHRPRRSSAGAASAAHRTGGPGAAQERRGVQVQDVRGALHQAVAHRPRPGHDERGGRRGGAAGARGDGARHRQHQRVQQHGARRPRARAAVAAHARARAAPPPAAHARAPHLRAQRARRAGSAGAVRGAPAHGGGHVRQGVGARRAAPHAARAGRRAGGERRHPGAGRGRRGPAVAARRAPLARRRRRCQ